MHVHVSVDVAYKLNLHIRLKMEEQMHQQYGPLVLWPSYFDTPAPHITVMNP